MVVVAGETGSGKTTQLPKFLLDCGLGQRGWIGCTQPRRVAALSVAERIAEELQVPLGREVGAKIRFTDRTGPETAVKVMTDGILLNELQEDPMLRNYEAILIDEAHERSLNIDFILGCLRQLIERRDDLKIVITSATIDTETFSKAFNGAPIIEVSGRMYPVDVHYRPPDEEAPDYIDAAARTIEEIVGENRVGDILTFLPAEHDIHELTRLLEGGRARSCQVLPLYGRLANADQQRIFQPSTGRRRIILSTNIAETSLTVPGIRYVVDTGLARVSRYSAHSHTQRLPIEPVARSSADQRKGRCGRVEDGTCYRLYTEEDYNERPRYNTPEIHRSNLASVILRMTAFRLGDVDNFPFIDPPPESAIRGGYRLLAELGAIATSDKPDEARKLTPLGKRLARLPVDPTVGRMLLQAGEEGAVAEVLVIAAGLSIQDPRERPSEAAADADAAHRQFVHQQSDFLTLLHIWNAFHRELETLSQNQLRKFCRKHFLSYQRMREWRDVHQQLERLLEPVLRENGKKRDRRPLDPEDYAERKLSGYAAIHKSILAGLLGNIAVKYEGHEYRGPRNRSALLFPGSGLFDQKAAKQQRKAAYAKKKPAQAIRTAAPDWIVCGQWMETSRLYARTAAAIEVDWIEAVAGELLQRKYVEPFWSEKSAAALCKERTLLFGLEIRRRQTRLSPIDPATATDIFVRNGLVEEGIKEIPEFLQHNRGIREQAESELARRRMGSSLTIEDRLTDFYRKRLLGVGSFADLRTFAKKKHGGSLDFLKARLADLLPEESGEALGEAFPTEIAIGGSRLALTYRHEPGNEADGVTLRVPIGQLDALRASQLDWAVPGHREETIYCLLRALPKSVRVQLHPLREKSAQICRDLPPSERSLPEALAAHLDTNYRIHTRREDWASAEVPQHLQPRIEVEDKSGQTLAAGRNLTELRQTLQESTDQVAREKGGLAALPAWREAAKRMERKNLTSWDFGDLPESIDLSDEASLPLRAYPALCARKGRIDLRLLPDFAAAARETARGWLELAEAVNARDCAWLQRDLRDLRQLGFLLLPLGGYEALAEPAWQHLRRHLYRCDAQLPLEQAVFARTLARAEEEKRGLVPRFVDALRALLEAREEVATLLEKKQTARALTYPGMRAQLEQLAPADLLEQYDYTDLPRLTRFLKGMIRRAERAKSNLKSDLEKAQRLVPQSKELAELETLAKKAKAPKSLQPYRLLLEEYKISIFAQELGTGEKVSAKRLETLATRIRRELS